ncbi:hypothetical protein BH09ACT12_BH09ACT12_28740 [soil metagenome]
MTSVRRVCLAAAASWVLMHLVLGALYVDATTQPSLYVAAMVLAAAATFMALEPFLGWAPLPRGWDVVVVASGSLGSTLLVLPFLPDHTVTTYASWPLGASGVCIAGLVLRGRSVERVAAIGLALVQAALPWASRRWWGDDVSAVDAIFLGVPPVLWLLSTLGLDAILGQADLVVDRYWTKSVGSVAALHAAEDEETVVAARLVELRHRATPLLIRLADGAVVDEGLAREAFDTAAALRDDLRARSILDDRLRHAVAQARARGAEIVLDADPLLPDADHAHAELVAEASRALLDILPKLEHADQLSLRVRADPPSAVLVMTPRSDKPRVIRLMP